VWRNRLRPRRAATDALWCTAPFAEGRRCAL